MYCGNMRVEQEMMAQQARMYVSANRRHYKRSPSGGRHEALCSFVVEAEN